MRPVESFRNRVYLRKIALFVTLGIVLLITVFSAILYFFIENLVLRIEGESNKNLMNQVQYNVRFIGQTIKNSCEHLYLNSDVSYIMNFGSTDSDFEEGMIRMNLVWKSVKDSNPFIHSVFIYNSNNRRFYSTYGGMLFEDTGLLDYLKDRENLPRMVPVFRKFKGDTMTFGASESVMSYFIYDTYDRESGMKSGMVVNVKLQWLLDNLNEVNMNKTDKDNRLFLMDSTGEFVDQDNKEQFLTSIKSGYLTHIEEGNPKRDEGFFTTVFNREKFLVTYYQLDNTGVTVFRTTPYEQIQAYVFQLQRVMMFVFVLFLIVTVIESLIISKRIYNPFGSMVARVRSMNGKMTGSVDDRDEFSYLNTVYDKNAEMLEAYRNETRSNSSIVKTYLLRSLLTDGGSGSLEETARALKGSGITLETDTRYRVAVIQIDRYEALMENWKAKDRDLIKFAIVNIGCEIIAREYANDGLDMGDDCVCLIVCIKDENRFGTVFPELLQELQTILGQYYDLSITVSVSGTAESLNDLPKAYTETSEASYYRYVFGRGSRIFPERIAEIGGGSLQYTEKMEKKLFDALMTGDAQKVEQELQTALELLSRMSYEDVIISQVQILRILSQAVTELNRNRLEPVTINFNELYRLPFHIETLEDFFSHLIGQLRSVLEKDRAKTVESRHVLLIETVHAIIHEKYPFSTLCLDEIAQSLNISSRQLSRIYKSGTGRTVPEQINEVRLARAAELLEHSGFSVGEVALKVGIESETYFYSMFKKKFGTTPKEYAAAKSLKRG